MKSVLAICVFFVTLFFVGKATSNPGSVEQLSVKEQQCWNLIQCYEAKVNDLLNNQIAVELTGQYTYLYLSHIFMKSDLYYPNAAAYFRKKSDEEMGHAERFIDYQNQRGGTFKIKQIQKFDDSHCKNIRTLKKGFTCARHLEVHVTRALTQLLGDVSNVKKFDNTSLCSISRDKTSLLFAQPIMVEYTRNAMTEYEPFNLDLKCDGVESLSKVKYVELSEMIVHEFLGHQLEDTKELANFENTLKGFDKLGSFLADKEFDL